MVKKLSLGKNVANLGLKDLFGELETAVRNANSPDAVMRSARLQKLPIELIQPAKRQPRKAFEQTSLEELAESIRKYGLLQPIIIRSTTGNNYEIIAGERRWRAAQLAGLHEIPVILRHLNDEQALAVSLIENIQREDLNVIEEAEVLQRLSDEFTMTHQEIAEAIGKSRATISNLLRLLNLTQEVKTLVSHGELEMGHARALLALPASQQMQVARTVIAKSLSVRETERLIANLSKRKNICKKQIEADLLKLQQELSDNFGARIVIRKFNKNKGHLVIHYNSLDEFDGILTKLRR